MHLRVLLRFLLRLKPLIVLSLLNGLLLASCSESGKYTNSKTSSENSAKQSATAVKQSSNNDNIGQNILANRTGLAPKLAPK